MMHFTSPDLCQRRTQKATSLQVMAGIFVLIFGSTRNIRSTTSGCKVQSSFQCWVLPRTREGVSL